jgi:PBP1b-binding outer membrane lipoprotein LpoB
VQILILEKMKKYLIILIAFLFAFSCSDDRDIEPEQPYKPLSVNTLELYIDGKKFEPHS